MKRESKSIRAKSKYRAIPTIVDGIRFASKLEAKRYGELKLMKDAGYIRELVIHPRYPLIVYGKEICTYIADFTYIDERGKIIVEDTKGVKTAEYKLKNKLFHAIYPRLIITEITK